MIRAPTTRFRRSPIYSREYRISRVSAYHSARTVTAARPIRATLIHDLLDNFSILLILQDDLLRSIVRHLLLDQVMIRIVFGQMTIPCHPDLPPPDIQLDGLPQLGLCGTIGRIQYGIHDIPVIEGLLRRLPVLKGIENIGEHMIVAEIVDLITQGEQPAACTLGLLRHIVCALAGREHLQPRPQTTIDPDRPLRTHYLIAQVHPATKGPADLKLPDGPILIFDQPDRVILRIDRLDLCICPAHYFDRPDVFADKGPPDLHTMTAQVEDTAAAGLIFVPEP